MAFQLRATALTHQGAVRPNNEDCILINSWLRNKPMERPETFTLDLPTNPLVLVADGMGGHAAGEVASTTVAEHFRDHAATAMDDAAVTHLLHESHQQLIRLMAAQPSLDGMGTTVAGLALGPDRGLAFNVGDSRIYELRGHHLTQLSTDDSPGPKLADGRTAKMKSAMLLQVMGGDARGPDLDPHLLPIPIGVDLGWLVCSDGLTDMVEPDVLETLIDEDDVASVERMFQAAIRAGGHDNISIILLRWVTS